MSDKLFTDQNYLKSQQYGTSDKLSARIRLHQEYSTNKQGVFRWLWEYAFPVLPAHAEVLEAGTGRGDMWMENQDRIPHGWNITLTDFSAGMLENNRSFLGSIADRMHYDVMDVQHIPYENNRFDIVFANMMLYHVPDVPRALAEIRRVLKPDGMLIAMTNGDNHMREMYELSASVDPTLDPPQLFARTFSMQNGEEKLRQQFADVRWQIYPCDLLVTDVQPMLDYIASMMSIPGEDLMQQHEPRLRELLAAHIAREGGIRIRKETGAFVASGTLQSYSTGEVSI
jgi:SAM-dependent methyltransferase